MKGGGEIAGLTSLNGTLAETYSEVGRITQLVIVHFLGVDTSEKLIHSLEVCNICRQNLKN